MIMFYRLTTSYNNRLREAVLEEREPAESQNYLRTDWQVLSEMGPQFDVMESMFNDGIVDINFE